MDHALGRINILPEFQLPQESRHQSSDLLAGNTGSICDSTDSS